MYNSAYDFQFYQGAYTPASYQWNYPLIYVPVTSYTSIQEFKNRSHYQPKEPQNWISTVTLKEQSSHHQNYEEFSLKKDKLPKVRSKKSIIKKKRKHYGTKNTQANIINQTISFMHCKNKSRKLLEKLLKGDSRKIDIFYIMMKMIKKNIKKYVNRRFLKSVFHMDRLNFIHRLLSKGTRRLQILPLEQFKQTFRHLALYYFNHQMVTHLLTSNRITRNTIVEHLKRRREIMEYVF